MDQIAQFFLQIAKSKLDPEIYKDIYERAVGAERRRVENIPTLPKSEQVRSENLALKVGAHLADAPKPKIVAHAATRINERLDIAVSPSDLGELAAVVKGEGPDVRLLKTRMIAVGEYQVAWRGKNFVVVYDRSANRLITAYPKTKKKKHKVKKDQARRLKDLERVSLYEDDLEDSELS